MSPDGLNRRSVLKRGLFGGALLAVGGGTVLAFRGSKLVPVSAEGLEVLDQVEYSVVAALARRIVVPAKGPSVDEVRVAFNFDRVLGRASGDARKEVKQLLRLFENALAGFLFGARTAPFTAMSSEAQDEVLREWRDSRLEVRRTGFTALRTIVMASYYGAEQAWPAASYPGPPMRAIKETPVFTGAGGPPRTGLGIYQAPEAAPPPAVPPEDKP